MKEFPHLFKKIVNKQNEIKNFRVDANHLNKVVLIAPKELNKLPQDIVSDIKRTEKIIEEAGTPKTLYNMIQKKQEWFSLRTPVKDSLIFNYIIRNDARFILNDSSAAVKDNFYQITFYEKELQLIYLAILNSSFSRYFIENTGRSYGSGLLKIQKYELDSLPILDYRYLSANDLNALVSKAKMLLEDNSKILIKEIDEVLAKYYLEERHSNMEEFYIDLDKQIVGRLNK